MSLSMQTSSFLLLVSTPTETLMGRGWDYRLIQKKGRFVRIIGNLQDSRTRTLVFRWTLETLKYLTGTACDLPDFQQPEAVAHEQAEPLRCLDAQVPA